MNSKAHSQLLGYAVAVVGVLLATWLRYLLRSALGDEIPFVTFFFAVVVAAWYGGFGPTLVAVALSALIAMVYLLAPVGQLQPESAADWAGLALFLTFGLATALISEWLRRQSDQLRLEREKFAVTLSSIGDAVIATDTEGRVTFLNQVAEELTGWPADEAHGRRLDEVFRIINEGTRQPVESPSEKALREGSVVGLANHTILISRNGKELPIDDSAAPIRNEDGSVRGVVLVFHDVTQRREAEHAEREYRNLLRLRLKLSTALTGQESRQAALQQCTEVIVESLDVAFARIWTLDENEQVLQLQASSGIYTHLDGEHSRVRVGEFKIGTIARSRRPHLTNDVQNDPRISDPQWAHREGMVAFAGYPLLIGDHVLGVVAMFARRPLSQTVLDEMAPIADAISQYLERKRQEMSLHRSEELHRILSELAADYGLVMRVAPDEAILFEYATDGFQGVTGYTVEEVDELGWQILIPEEDLGVVEDSLQRWLAGETHASESRVRTKSGDVIRVEYYGRAEPIPGSDEMRVFLAAQDVTEEREAQEELDRQREWLSVTLTSVGDALIATDADGVIRFLNPIAQRLTGWAPEEAVGQPLETVFRIFHEKTREPAQNPVEKVIQKGQIVGLANHTVLIRKDGSEVPIEDSAAPIVNRGKELIGVVLVFRDVTEKRQWERERRKSEERFRSLVDASSQIVWTTDAEGRVVEDSPSWREFTGQTLEQWQGWGWLDAVHLDDRERIRQEWSDAVAEKRIFESEFRVQRVDGLYRWMAVRAVPVLEEDGSIREWVGMNSDITERRQADEALRESESRLRFTLDATLTGLWDLDLIADSARRTLRHDQIFGYDTLQEEWSFDRFLSEHVLPEDREDVARRFQHTMTTGEDFEFECRIRRVDEIQRWIWAKGGVYEFSDGRPARMSGLVMDVTERKEAEERIREQEAQYHGIFESTSDAILIFDEEGKLIDVNPAACTMHGYTREEMIGTHGSQIVHPDDHHKFVDFLDQVAVGETFHVDGTHVRKDGNQISVKVTGTSFSFAGRPALIAVLRDITEEKKAVEALRESEEFTRRIIESSHDCIKVLDLEGRLLSMNPGGQELLEIEALDTVLNQRWPDFWKGEDRKRAMEVIAEAARGGTGRFEGFCPTITGKPKWWDVVVTPICSTAGQPERLLSVSRDITERNEVEQQLRESEEKFRNLADNISQFAWMTDETGSIFWYNQRWFEYTGTTLEDMQGWGWEAVQHPDHVDRVVERFRYSIETGEPWEDRFPIRGKDGEYRWFLSRALPIRDESGTIVRWFGTNTDIDEERQLQEELRNVAARLSEADRRKDEFLATLAHELRNPLAPIRTGLEVMKLAKDDPATLEEIRSTMERQTQQLITLVDDLLEVSRITRGKLQLRKCRVKLDDVIQTSVEASQLFIDEAGHTLSIDLPDEPIYLQADPHRLAQVVSNLLNNAAKYTPEGGNIWLSGIREGSDVVVSVRDDGLGIPEEQLESIFEMFAQIDRSMEQGYTGLGIGLTLVRSLVELHGGRVEVRSEGENRGSEFLVRLPILIETSVPQELPAAQPRLSQRPLARKVLVVDDNRAGAEMLSMIVRMLGNEVRTAFDGHEGVKAAEEFRPDVVIMDLGMPRMNGYEAARQIRQQDWGQGMMLIALTGWGQNEDKQRTREAGFDYHVVKPADPAELEALLQRPG